MSIHDKNVQQRDQSKPTPYELLLQSNDFCEKIECYVYDKDIVSQIILINKLKLLLHT